MEVAVVEVEEKEEVSHQLLRVTNEDFINYHLRVHRIQNIWCALIHNSYSKLLKSVYLYYF